MTPNSITIRRRTPEATVFTTIAHSTGDPNLVIVNAGKAGSRLAGAADALARTTGAALRGGVTPERLVEIMGGIRHQSSNGDWEAASLADAVAQSLEKFVEEVQDES